LWGEEKPAQEKGKTREEKKQQVSQDRTKLSDFGPTDAVWEKELPRIETKACLGTEEKSSFSIKPRGH